ncbi:MAG: asparagine synthase (glutamine-hydrolyzing), partial [Candidatus Thorarchaeota archaeon]
LRTTSDTEVILESFAKLGPNILQQFNGMFAFAIWDKEQESLFVARDRLGIKPLYYFENEWLVAFASEMKAIIPLVQDLQPNDEIVYDYLAFGRVDHLDDTFFEGIHRFPAGHYGIISKDTMRLARWFDIARDINGVKMSSKYTKRSLHDHILTFRRLFSDAVKLRLRSDVPVGSCLSGGIDSSCVVTAAMQFLSPETKKNFQTYSAVYGPWFKQDERKYIDIVTKHAGIKSNFTIPKVTDWVEAFSSFIYHQEEPITTLSPITQFYVMQLAHSNGAKVLLDGQGGDEILGGYSYMAGYYMAELLETKQLPKLLKEILTALRTKNIIAFKVFLYQFLPRGVQKRLTLRTHRLLAKEFVCRFRNRYLIEKLLYLDKDLNKASINHLKFKLQHLLRYEDRSAMAFGVETRVPFLD